VLTRKTGHLRLIAEPAADADLKVSIFKVASKVSLSEWVFGGGRSKFDVRGMGKSGSCFPLGPPFTLDF
jgi:hypothetical protein